MAINPDFANTNDLLLIIDVQNDFCPGGALAVNDGDAVVPVINRLSERFSRVGLTQDWHTPEHISFASTHGADPYGTFKADYGDQTLWPDHCVQNTRGAEFHPDLETRKAEFVIRKGFRRGIDSYSAFFENDQVTPTGLKGFLKDRQIDRIFMVGLATDFCVAWSALDARKHDFETYVIEDACRAIDLNGSLETARTNMRDAGVKLINSTEVLS